MSPKGATPAEPKKWEFSNPDWPIPVSAPELANMKFEPKPPVIHGLLHHGLTCFGGRPKAGKSWMALNLAYSIATGGKALGQWDVEQGRVLYLALEDNQRRLLDRINSQQDEAPPLLHLLTDDYGPIPSLQNGGLAYLEEALKHYDDFKLVVIDTLVRWIDVNSTQDQYAQETKYAAQLQQMALKHNIAMLLIQHTRKSESFNVIDSIKGHGGVTGVADSYWVLGTGNHSNNKSFHVDGRDIEEPRIDEDAYNVEFDIENNFWKVNGTIKQRDISAERQLIIDHITKVGPQQPIEVSRALNIKQATARQMLRRMAKNSELDNSNGRYSIPGLFP